VPTRSSLGLTGPSGSVGCAGVQVRYYGEEGEYFFRGSTKVYTLTKLADPTLYKIQKELCNEEQSKGRDAKLREVEDDILRRELGL
jgi:hypothetical protein